MLRAWLPHRELCESPLAVFKLDKNVPKEFAEHTWDVRKLEGYKKGIGAGLPFSVSLMELMKAKVSV